jgi:3-methyladenine DNA glycosylase AlkC
LYKSEASSFRFMLTEEKGMAIALQRIEELSRGDSASRTLAEILAIDFNTLITSLDLLDAAGIRTLPPLGQIGIAQRVRTAADHLIRHSNESSVRALAHHQSDTVRGIAAFAVAQLSRGARVPALLSSIENFADDQHFGVREWAWMAVRDPLAEDLEEAIAALVAWTSSPRPFVRRFAVEVLRPRGVWAKHISALRAQPERGMPLLEPLNREREKYVQDSVANWLNDAAKDHPAWVITVCERWLRECGGDIATQRICTRAQRSLKLALNCAANGMTRN